MLAPAIYKDLVLVGGGHSHVAVLKSFGMRPLPGVRITLVTRTTATPYSGMLPGLVAGHYTYDEAHIDLAPLCRFAGARLIRAEAVGLDPESGLLHLEDRPAIAFDLLSINSGSTPLLPAAARFGTNGTPVKPVDAFLDAWAGIRERAANAANAFSIGIVGGGAGGVELGLAIKARLDADGNAARVEILTADPCILPTHNAGARARLQRALARNGITCRYGARVTAASESTLTLESGESLPFDEVVWVTQAAAPSWFRDSGLALDANGFVLVDDRLQSTSHANVFAAGDVAAMRNHPRPKSGVFAVRQGRPLALNLRNALLARPLRRYCPQREFLSLIGTSDGAAVASRGHWSAAGRSIWRWKEWIDRRFMRRYQDLPPMAEQAQPTEVPAAIVGDEPPPAASDAMRCGGCGAKVSADVLDRVLSKLPRTTRPDVETGLNAPDDAALLSVPPDRQLAVSIDAFRPMIDDPYLFGRITANHCMNDLFAMGADPQSALAIVTLPNWPAAKLIEEMRQLLLGAVAEFDTQSAALVGGHTAEGAELSLGFSVTGLVERGKSLTKSGLEPGDRLVLTKPLGTGTVLAANMRGKAKGRWLDAAIETMCMSNAAAVPVLRTHRAHACTDITGFGLFGHLLEMAVDGAGQIALDLDALPDIDGAIECLDRGITSTMHPANEKLRQRATCSAALTGHGAFPLLFDPQTAGGLLAAVPEEQANACLDALRATGFRSAAVVGIVRGHHEHGARFDLLR